MRNLGYFAIVSAAFALAACQAVEPAIPEIESTQMITASFGAEVSEPAATKAALTPNEGETAFEATWSAGDAIRVDYYAIDYSDEVYEDTVEAIWDGSAFSAVLPDVTGLWEYRACYPYPEEGALSFGSYREQTGKEYNSMYDIMMSSAVGTSDAAAGKTESGANVVFPMERQTAIVRFHFTGTTTDAITCASLSVSGGAICAGEVSLSPSEVSFEDTGSRIDLFPEGLTADDIVLWFNVLPGSFDSLTIKVETATEHFTFTRGAGSFEKGVLYNIAMDVPADKWEETTELVDNSYTLVTSEPADWSGTYLAAYVSGSEAKVYTGVDAVSNYVSTLIDDDRIDRSGSMAELVVEAVDGGYAVKVVGGTNDGKYISGGTSNGTTFGTDPVPGEFIFNGSASTVKFTTNGTTSFQFNSASDQQRFRFFKSEQKPVSFFRKGGSGNVTTTVTVTTSGATGVSQAEAVLGGSYTASVTPSELGFLWGTSADEIDNELYVGSGSGSSGNFSKSLAGLSASTTYWFRAYAVVGGTYYYGDAVSFTTSAEIGTEGTDTAYAMSWLGGYEVPATSVSVSESDLLYAGHYCHTTVGETYGDTKACIYNTGNATQRVVTHTYSYNGNVYPNYTMLYDADKHCALWEAFVLGGSENNDNNVGRNDSWAYDPAIPSAWQPDLKSAYTGYTRGHAIASNYRQTTTAQNKQTFYFSNMTPQSSSLNSGSWNSLEQKVKGLSTQLKGSSRLYVVTGPVFDSGYGYAKDRNSLGCPVPTRYYKCIMVCEFGSDGKMTSAKGAGYMFNHTGDLSRQDMTIDQVEAITGFDFFANVPDSIESGAEASSYHFF